MSDINYRDLIEKFFIGGSLISVVPLLVGGLLTNPYIVMLGVGMYLSIMFMMIYGLWVEAKHDKKERTFTCDRCKKIKVAKRFHALSDNTFVIDYRTMKKHLLCNECHNHIKIMKRLESEKAETTQIEAEWDEKYKNEMNNL